LSNTHSQIDAHIADLAQHRLINDSGTSTIELFSASKVLALIAGVNGAIAGTLIFKGGYDAATNTPDLDVAPAGAIQQGWTYVVTVAGTFYRRCRSRDLIISKQNAPTTLAHYTVDKKHPGYSSCYNSSWYYNFSYSRSKRRSRCK
jgi:hypothetical protein